MNVPVLVRTLPHAKDLPLPSYATAGAAGLDLLAAVHGPVTIAPGARCLIPTGLMIALPPGYELQIRPRSGLALRHGIVLFTVERGARIAQAVLAPVSRVAWRETDDLSATARGTGGFGSTGVGGT
jgi:dUTP pyrophosphatase